MTDLRVDLFGIQCNNRVPDVNGCVWTVNELDGWESPEQESPTTLVTGRSGVVGLGDRHGGRALVARGSVRAPSDAAAWAAYNLVIGSMPGLGGQGPVVVYEPVPKMLPTVRQADKPFAKKPRSRYFKFELTLVAHDPYKVAFSPTTVSVAAGATVSLTHNGTAPAFVTVTSTGSGTVRVRQNSSGQVLRTRASVASGTVFDPASRTVRSAGGVSLYGVMDSPSEWLSVPRTSSTSFTNQGTAPVDLTIFDTFA